MKTGKTIGLISCVSKKKDGSHKAKDLYISSLFFKAKEYAEKNLDKYYILSAKYGLLDPDEVIETYNETLKDKKVDERKKWAEDVFVKLKLLLGKDDEIVFLAGKYYREFLETKLDEIGISYQVPLTNYPIGKQLQWYDKKLSATNK